MKAKRKKHIHQNLEGKIFGRWTVLSYAGRIKDAYRWECKCECGKISQVREHLLLSGGSQSCGCNKSEIVKKRHSKYLLGKSFGRLSVIKKTGPSKWLCKCECGNTTEVLTYNLTNGNTQSCGCLRFERLNGIHYTERDIQLDIFRPVLSSHKNRRRAKSKIESDLSLQNLKDVWDKQKGICPYTGLKLLLPAWRDKRKMDPHMASLDRIDSKLGYFPNNIQFVSVIANYAKNTFSHEQMVEFCKAIANYWKDKL